MSSNPFDLEVAAELYDHLFTEVRDLALLVELAHQAGGPILELACGTGRCVLPLTRAGFDVVGVDSSHAMLERLRAKTGAEPDEVAYRSTPIHGDGRNFSIPLRFGMAFIAASSFGMLLSRCEQEAFLANVFQHLRPGGLFIIDIFNPDPRRIIDEPAAERSHEEYRVVQTRLGVDEATQVLRSRTAYHRGETLLAAVDWDFRYTFRFELELLVEKAGYEILHLWGNYEKVLFGNATERLFLVARKPLDADMTVVSIMQARAAQPV